MNVQSITIAGVRVDVNSKEEIMLELDRIIGEKKKATFAYVNAHAFNLASEISWFKQFIQNSDIVVADGQGIRLACLLLRKTIPPHLPLTQWMWEILRMCEEKHYSVFLLGGQPEAEDITARNVVQTFPRLKLAGMHHGYFEKQGEESEKTIQRINDATPDLLLVAFGMPLQERWIKDNVAKLCVHLIMPVGGYLDELAGKRLQVPVIVRRLGFEWAWRFVQEPKRLFKRYILGNPMFMWRVLRESFKHE